MTHDELVEKVKLTLENYINLRRYTKRDLKLISYAIDSLKALRAVVGLHKPTEFGFCAGCGVDELKEYDTPYPCSTIQAIGEQLYDH